MSAALPEDVNLGDWLTALVERLSDPAERTRMIPMFGDKWARVTELPFSFLFALGELAEDTKAHKAR